MKARKEAEERRRATAHSRAKKKFSARCCACWGLSTLYSSALPRPSKPEGITPASHALLYAQLTVKGSHVVRRLTSCRERPSPLRPIFHV